MIDTTDVLTDEACSFLNDLQRAFGPRRAELLARREERLERLHAGELPDFLAATAEIRAGERDETLLLLEHDAVITVGKSGDAAHVLYPEAALAARGITLERASRGGDVTFHGPGQLVGYPLIRLQRGVRAYVEAMAAALIEVLGELGVTAQYKKDAPGLWVVDAAAPGGAAKICAFGVNIHHRITMHGFALNLDPDLEAFRFIVPCGLAGCHVTSVRALLGAAPSPAAVSERVAAALTAHLGVAFALGDALTNCNAPQGH